MRLRHKKLAIFLTCILLFTILLAFLLIYEESPLNRHFREEEAQKLYNQAMELYENKDYSSAISNYTWLIHEGARGFWGRYYDTECARSARMQEDELLPVWYYEWAEELYAEGEIYDAISKLKLVSLSYPEYQSEFITSRIRDMEIEASARASNAMKITLPEGTSKNLGGSSELIIINDSPRELHVYLRGPINMSITIDANNASYYRIGPPLLRSHIHRDVNETLILPPGNFEIAIDARLTIPAYGECKLLRNQSYELIFYVLHEYLK